MYPNLHFVYRVALNKTTEVESDFLKGFRMHIERTKRYTDNISKKVFSHSLARKHSYYL